jgi:hypothetical protein
MYRTNRFVTRLVISSICILLPVSACYAQATRTWVSGVGDDANPCSRTAPCKTFAGAISKTAAGGIIDALDPAGYGAVTITKSIQIESVGNVASALVAGTNGIVINAGATDTVSLRGLSINGIGTGLNGIRLLRAGKLIVENTNVDGFTQNGIDLESSVNTQVSLRNVTVTGSGNAGVWVFPSAGTTNVELDNVNLSQGKYGLYVVSGRASMKNSVASANSSYGVCASSNGTLVRIGVDDSLVSDNAGVGIRSVGAQSSIYVSRTSVTGNATGLVPATGALVSYGNNRIFENTTNGSFSATLMEQ